MAEIGTSSEVVGAIVSPGAFTTKDQLVCAVLPNTSMKVNTTVCDPVLRP